MSGQREGSAPVRPQPAWLSDLPGMVAQWHPTRNEPLDPLTLRVGSHRRVWWRCAQGHEWQAKVGSRTRRETGCPVCSVRRVSPTRNLAALYPEIATTWHSTANAPLTPDEVSPASSRRVWWRCAVGHEWQVAVANRVMYDCPFCSGRRVTAAISLAALYPNVAREWHPSRNGTRTPETVKPRSSIPVWWLCGRCGHEWRTPPSSRTVRGGRVPGMRVAFLLPGGRSALGDASWHRGAVASDRERSREPGGGHLRFRTPGVVAVRTWSLLGDDGQQPRHRQNRLPVLRG